MLTPNSSVTLIDVAEKSPFTNDGTTSLMLCSGALANCSNGTTFNSGTSGKVADGITSITVTNLSTTDNGSFTCKD
jgi:hypothetical protein